MIEDKIVEFKHNDLSHVLERKYVEISENMKKEDYIIEYYSFCQFHELILDEKVVGFYLKNARIPRLLKSRMNCNFRGTFVFIWFLWLFFLK